MIGVGGSSAVCSPLRSNASAAKSSAGLGRLIGKPGSMSRPTPRRMSRWPLVLNAFGNDNGIQCVGQVDLGLVQHAVVFVATEVAHEAALDLHF